MEKTDEMIAEIVTRLVDLGYAELPAILESSIELTRLEGIVQAVFGVVMLGAAICFGRKGKKFHDEGDETAIILWIASGLLGIFGLISLIADDIWIKMISPGTYLYKQLLFTTLN